MFKMKQCFNALSIQDFINKLFRRLRSFQFPLKLNCLTWYRVLFILIMILQFCLFMIYFDIKHSLTVIKTPTEVVEYNNQALLLKRKYYRARYKWIIPKNTTGIKFGREYVIQRKAPVFTVNLGPVNVTRSRRNLKWLEGNIPDIKLGGFYAPKHCRSEHKIAILVPYKNRPKSLVVFLNNIHRILRKQLIQYRVFVVEQYGNTTQFNKGALYNVAYIEIQKFGSWHCLVFHDVDLVLQNSRNLYSCSNSPVHLSPSVESQKYSLPYPELVGGVTAMTPAHFFLINGFSNSFWDWGGEDDDLYIRFTVNNLQIHRVDNKIGMYAHTNHERNKVNVFRYIDLDKTKRRYKREGLNSVAYKLINITKRKLFTHIMADVNPFNFKI